MPLVSQRIAIQIDTLSKRYTRRDGRIVQAVDNLSLSVPAGEVLGFLGPNGAGKTTTIKMVCGLVAPTAGTIRLNGYDVTRERRKAMGQIGAVLEGARNIYWRLTAWQNLLYFGRLKGQRHQLKERAEALLRDLGLWERHDDLVQNFSRGMQQKVAIACALMGDPPILLLDEPTLGLDVQAARTVKEWVMKLAYDQGKTVILTTHQLDVAEEVCHRVAIINHGRLIADKATCDLLGLFQQEHYQIRLQGAWNGRDSSWLNGLTMQQEAGETILTGTVGSQEELYRILERLRQQSLPLLAVNRVEANLEEVFVRLVEGGS
jgi:ABC-2 type transport system ATP-binding protein